METCVIDISHHNTGIRWNAIKNSGMPFVIIKGTQRTDFISPTLDNYIQECEVRQIPYWIYAYLEKGNEKAQASFLVRATKGLIGDYFVGYALDAEEGNSAKNIYPALDVIKSATKTGKAMFYGEVSVWKKIVANGSSKNVVFWEARYGKNDGTYNPRYAPSKYASLHQFTDNALTPFSSGEVDVNRLTGVTPLEWFIKPSGKIPSSPEPKGYPGQIPDFPIRGYFKKGDGILTYITYREHIKRVQALINWLIDADLDVDGKYGAKTAAAVELAQRFLGVKVDAYFGPETLQAALSIKK